jgi:hypothetical protein
MALVKMKQRHVLMLLVEQEFASPLCTCPFVPRCSGSLTLARDPDFGYTVFPAANLYAFGMLS